MIKPAISTRQRAFLGALLPAFCGAAIGCSESDPSIGEPTDTPRLEVQDAAIVLGFESPGAWASRERRTIAPSATHVQGEAALAVDIADRVSLVSAPFQFTKTPNVLEFSFRAPVVASRDERGGYAQAYLTCAGREVFRQLLGTQEFGRRAPQELTRISLVVPDSLQTALAAGCERLEVEIVLDVGAAPGTYVFDDSNLRAKTPRLAIEATPLCSMPDMNAVFPDAVERPEGYMDYQAWRSTPVRREELLVLEAALDAFPNTVLGAVPDDVTEQMVVIVDPAELERGQVLQSLEAADVALPMRIQPSCNPVAELRKVQAHFENGPFPAETPAFGAYLEPAIGKYVVNADPGAAKTALEIESDQRQRIGLAALPAELIFEPSADSRSFAQAARQRFGSLVEVQWARPGRRGRQNDGQPHYGGAGIGAGGSNFCTAGFVAYKNGLLGAVGAAHCFMNLAGTSPLSNVVVFSGPKLYGITGVFASYPLFDMIRIDNFLQSYTNTIHTDPGNPTTRVQVAKRNLAVGDTICNSGGVSGAKCSITVVNHTCTLAEAGGVNPTSGLTRASRQGVAISLPGDSGSPLYQPAGSVTATIVGIQIGGPNNFSLCGHRVPTIETQLGVQVAIF